MAKWTISKFFSIVVFIALMIVFFIWIAGNVSDLGLLFGFRGSHTVANDIASMITSVGGVPGTIVATYDIQPSAAAENRFKYDVDIRDRIVCVSSYLESRAAATSDCAAHPYDVKEELSIEEKECTSIRISKSQAGGEISELEVEETGCREDV